MDLLRYSGHLRSTTKGQESDLAELAALMEYHTADVIEQAAKQGFESNNGKKIWVSELSEYLTGPVVDPKPLIVTRWVDGVLTDVDSVTGLPIDTECA